MRQIENHPWGFMVRHEEKDKFSISFRSTIGAPNVRLICEKYFNGGGHNLAAGGEYTLQVGEEAWDSNDVANRVVEIIKNASLELVPLS